MNNLIKSKAKRTPYLLLDRNKGLIELKGSSIMEDAKEFYDHMMTWTFDYVKNPKDTTVNIDLEYFNGASAKILLFMFKTLSKIQKEGHILTVNWHYDEDDEDILDSGTSFSTLSDVKFNLIKKKQNSLSKAADSGQKILLDNGKLTES